MRKFSFSSLGRDSGAAAVAMALLFGNLPSARAEAPSFLRCSELRTDYATADGAILNVAGAQAYLQQNREALVMVERVGNAKIVRVDSALKTMIVRPLIGGQEQRIPLDGSVMVAVAGSPANRHLIEADQMTRQLLRLAERAAPPKPVVVRAVALFADVDDSVLATRLAVETLAERMRGAQRAALNQRFLRMQQGKGLSFSSLQDVETLFDQTLARWSARTQANQPLDPADARELSQLLNMIRVQTGEDLARTGLLRWSAADRADGLSPARLDDAQVERLWRKGSASINPVAQRPISPLAGVESAGNPQDPQASRLQAAWARFKSNPSAAQARFIIKEYGGATLGELRRAKPDLIIPVPGRGAKETTQQIAIGLAQALDDQAPPPIKNYLRHLRQNERSQSSLAIHQRTLGTAGNFGVNLEGGARAGALQGKTVMLVDDVTTTGSTLHEAMRICYEQGAARVVMFSLVRTAD